MKGSLEKKIALGFGAAVFLLLLVTVGAAWDALRFRGAYAHVKQTYEILVRLDQVLTQMLAMETSTRGYLLTGMDEALRPFQTSSARIDESLRDLERLVADKPAQVPRAVELASLAARARQQMEERINTRRIRGREFAADASSLRQSQRQLQEFWGVVRDLAAEERRHLDQWLKEAYAAGRLTIFTAIGACLLAIACVTFAFVQVRRDLARRREAEAALQESYTRIRDLYDHAPCGYHSLNAEGMFVAVNETALSWLGYTRDEVLGRMRFADILTTESAALFEERFREFMRTGRADNVEYEWRRKDGTTFHVLLNATATYDASGAFVASRATVFDVTRRKQAEIERDRFFTVSRDLLCIASFEGYFKRVNPSWEAVLGYKPEEQLDRPIIEFIHADDRSRTEAEIARLTQGHDSVDFENRYRCRDGTYRWLRWNARGIAAERLVYASARDVTERKEADERIQMLNSDLSLRASQLEAANHELESFSYSVSHDLRAPLRHIDGFAALLEKKMGPATDPEARRFLTTISRAAKQMGALIDDLLAFSRIGRTPLRQQLIDHPRLVADVIADGRYRDSHPAVTWEVGALPEVRADPVLLRQVWANLIENAVKYSSKSVHPRIEIGALVGEPAAGENVFFIRDNGVGFDMTYSDKLFGVFQRLHGPAEFEGTGIGLANVRRIVTRHGGRTWAEGRVGEGARFYFSLPATPLPARTSS